MILRCEHKVLSLLTMKHKHIGLWSFAILVGVAFLSLLYMQGRYVTKMVQLRREQFDQ